jgi:hypothetical protein
MLRIEWVISDPQPVWAIEVDVDPRRKTGLLMCGIRIVNAPKREAPLVDVQKAICPAEWSIEKTSPVAESMHRPEGWPRLALQ